MKINIELTWSKLVAVAVLVLAFILELKTEGTGFTVFQYSLPFVVFLITGKQIIDLKRNGS